MSAVAASRVRTWWTAASLCLALAACKGGAPTRVSAPFASVPAIERPTWIGEYRWSMQEGGEAGEPARLRLGFTALPSGDWSATGSVVLDDAELGAIGSARLRQGRLLVDLLLSGGVRDAPLDAGKRALFPAGQAPARIASAGFATVRIELDPRTLQGVAQRYQVNVVEGDHVQGPIYADSTLTLDRTDAP